MPAEAAAQLTEYFRYLGTKYDIEAADQIDETARRPRSARDDEPPAA